jgi:carboxymethylenebutenolidase
LSSSGCSPADEDKARDTIGKLDMEKTTADAVAAASFLRGFAQANGKVGAVGFCWGGGLVNRLAVADSQLSAAVAYYGRQPDAADVPKIKAALMLHYAGLDDRINAGIPDLEKALKAAGTQYELFMYEGANHAFNNDTSEARYNKAAADLAWSRTVEFLKRHLAA